VLCAQSSTLSGRQCSGRHVSENLEHALLDAGLRALSTAVRVEKDTMGSLEVPADR